MLTVHSALAEKTWEAGVMGLASKLSALPLPVAVPLQVCREFWKCADVTDHSVMLVRIKY